MLGLKGGVSRPLWLPSPSVYVYQPPPSFLSAYFTFDLLELGYSTQQHCTAAAAAWQSTCCMKNGAARLGQYYCLWVEIDASNISAFPSPVDLDHQ